MLHPIISTRKSQFADCFLQGLWTRGLLNCSLRDPETPLLILDSSHKAPKPRNLPLPSSRSSYFNIILCRSVLVYLSDSASLHFMKGVSQEPPSPSARLSSTLSPAHCPSFPPSLQCGSPGPGPQSSPASWPVPPYKKATHGQEVTAGSSSRLSATFLRWHPLPLGSNRHLGITTPSTLECLLFDCKRENTIHSQIQDVVSSIASYYIQE